MCERYGEHRDDGWIVFTCGEDRCQGLAGAVQLVEAGQPIDMGTPIGMDRSATAAGLVVKAFRSTSWYRIERQETLDAVRTQLQSERPDPAVGFPRIDPHCLPFYCPPCRRNYCRAGWSGFPYLRDDGYYLTDIPRPHDHGHSAPTE